MSKGKQSKVFFIGAIVGGVIGSVSALLFAPKSGKELRQDISSGAQKVSQAAVRTASEVSDTTGRLVKEIGEGASQFAAKIKQAASAKETLQSGEVEAAAAKEE